MEAIKGRPKISQQLWYLMISNFKSMIREVGQVIWIFGYPIVFMLLFKFAYGQAVWEYMAPGVIILGPVVLISQLAGLFAP